MNIQQPTKQEVAGTDTVIDYNVNIDPPLPQGILNVFAVAYLPYHSSSDSAKYKRAWNKAKVIRSSILYSE